MRLQVVGSWFFVLETQPPRRATTSDTCRDRSIAFPSLVENPLKSSIQFNSMCNVPYSATEVEELTEVWIRFWIAQSQQGFSSSSRIERGDGTQSYVPVTRKSSKELANGIDSQLMSMSRHGVFVFSLCVRVWINCSRQYWLGCRTCNEASEVPDVPWSRTHQRTSHQCPM